MAGIIQGGSATVEFKVFPTENGDRSEGNVASVESIKLDEYVVKVDDSLTAGDAVATCTRALKVLTADKIAGTGNLSRVLNIVTAATAGSLSVVKVGDAIEIGGVAQGTVTEIIDNTNVRVSASGTTGAGTWTYQRPLFAKVFPGATLVLATGTTTVVVESKTSDFAVNTVTSGTITTGLLTSYKNVDSIARYKEDGSRGEIYGIAMDSFTFDTAYGVATPVQMKVKVFGQFDKTKTTTIDHPTAGTVPQSVHASVYGRLFHTSTTRIF